MKIKNLLFVLVAALFFVSCSKDGSRTIQLDEFSAIVTSDDDVSIEKCKKTSELFSLVPGEYTISWKVKDEAPQLTNYNATMVIKLKLNKKLSVKEEWIKKADNFGAPIFYFVDANGNKLHGTWHVAWQLIPGEDGLVNKDQFMDFVKFLQSEPGTEMDVTLGTMLVESSGGAQDIADIKNAKGIIMEVKEDDVFERNVGEILD